MYFVSLQGSIKSAVGRSIFHVTPKSTSGRDGLWPSLQQNMGESICANVLASTVAATSGSLLTVLLLVLPVVCSVYLTVINSRPASQRMGLPGSHPAKEDMLNPERYRLSYDRKRHDGCHETGPARASNMSFPRSWTTRWLSRDIVPVPRQPSCRLSSILSEGGSHDQSPPSHSSPERHASTGGSRSRSTVVGFAARLQLVAVSAAMSDSRRGSAFARYARGDAKRLPGHEVALVPG